MLPDFRALMLWALGLGLAGALLIAGIERDRSAAARTEAATARKDLAAYRAMAAESARFAECAQRTQEQTWRSRVEGVIEDGQQKNAVYRVAVDRAGAAERKLRDEVAAYRAAIRAAGAAAAAAEGRASATAPLDLLVDLFGRANTRARELASIADERGAAGSICERYFDAMTAN
ncbi:DUF2514 family protein [Variovorax sp. GB1P17]|uniref:DUF2514 family protein n=1 Tax=Variovorax sp. GB1P17 TaxID=3443740 RepID=UPI003F48DA1F